MNQWIIMPILIPAVAAALVILTARFDLVLARVFCIGANLMSVLVATILLVAIEAGQPETYALGGWDAPLGIVLVVDRLAALMLWLTAVVGSCVSVAAIDGEDDRGRYFHALLLLQMLGINGAFLTGDLFNLFVFFEVMLLASYGLMVHGGGPSRLRAGVQFVILNLVGSTIFLVAVGLVYGACGSLTLADIPGRLAAAPAGSQAISSSGIALMMGVFAVKAALVPFHVWLPATYAEAPPLVTALFAVTTKVGIFALLRVGLALDVWAEDGGIEVIRQGIIPVALVTVAVGAIGVWGARRLTELAGYAVLGSMGMILVGIGLETPAGLAAALYYVIHSTVAGATLFLIGWLVQENRGRWSDHLRAAEWPHRKGLIAASFFCAAVAMGGIPPLSGFIGKLLVLDASRSAGSVSWIWSAVLVASLFNLIGLARAGILLFWSGDRVEDSRDPAPVTGVLTLVIVGLLLAAIVGLTLGSGVALEYMNSLAAELMS